MELDSAARAVLAALAGEAMSVLSATALALALLVCPVLACRLIDVLRVALELLLAVVVAATVIAVDNPLLAVLVSVVAAVDPVAGVYAMTITP